MNGTINLQQVKKTCGGKKATIKHGAHNFFLTSNEGIRDQVDDIKGIMSRFDSRVGVQLIFSSSSLSPSNHMQKKSFGPMNSTQTVERGVIERVRVREPVQRP